MGNVIVIEFVTLDGIITDPDGSAGTAGGGWAFRHGPEAVAGDKFRLGDSLRDGVMLLGRNTWQLFAGIWSGRSDGFAAQMNAIPKLVASRSLTDVSAWNNSALIDGELLDVVRRERAGRDVIITGSVGVVRALQAADLVDEYRLLTFPTVLGDGDRLFASPAASPLQLASVDRVGPAVLSRYDVAR